VFYWLKVYTILSVFVFGLSGGILLALLGWREAKACAATFQLTAAAVARHSRNGQEWIRRRWL
jgi:hypothetical protein